MHKLAEQMKSERAKKEAEEQREREKKARAAQKAAEAKAAAAPKVIYSHLFSNCIGIEGAVTSYRNVQWSILRKPVQYTGVPITPHKWL